jgi:hypothetical protein
MRTAKNARTVEKFQSTFANPFADVARSMSGSASQGSFTAVGIPGFHGIGIHNSYQSVVAVIAGSLGPTCRPYHLHDGTTFSVSIAGELHHGALGRAPSPRQKKKVAKNCSDVSRAVGVFLKLRTRPTTDCTTDPSRCVLQFHQFLKAAASLPEFASA